MGDNEKIELVDDVLLVDIDAELGGDDVERVDDEVSSDSASVDSDDYVPKGCQKLYLFNDGPATQHIIMDDGSKLRAFRANRKPAEKYYETIKSNSICFYNLSLD